MKVVNDNVVAIVECKRHLDQMTITELCGGYADNFVRSCEGDGPAELWHCQFGHLDVRSIYALHSMVRGMILNKLFRPTSTLVLRSLHGGYTIFRKWGNNVERLVTNPLEIVHSDICGPMRTTSMGGTKYFVILLIIS